MKYDIKRNKNIVNFTITVDPTEFKQMLEEEIDKKIQELEVDGFRKGKMPKAMFIRKYGYDSVIPDTIDKVLNKGIDQIIHENELEILEQVQIDWEKLSADVETGFSCTGSVEVMPEFTLTDYKDVYKEVKQPEVKVTKKAIKEVIDQLLAEKAVMEVSNKASKKGDEVIIDFVGSVNGEEFPGGSGENYPLTLGSGSFIPGFEDQLIGHKAGDEVEVKVTFPEQYHAADLAGKDAVFKTKIHEVKSVKKAKLTDEIVKEIKQYSANTVEELEQQVEAELEKQQEAQNRQKYEEEVLAKIAKINKIKVPKKAVELQVNHQINKMTQDLAQMGMNLEMYLTYIQTTEEEFRKKLAKEATKAESNAIVLREIIRQENIKATKKDLDDVIAKFAKSRGITKAEAEKLFEEDKKVNPQVENDINLQIKAQKAIDLILGE